MSIPDAEHGAAPSLFAVPELRDGDVVLRPATGAHALALSLLMRDAQTQLLTGSVHSTAEAERGARGEEGLWPPLGELEEVYERWSVAEDRAVWVIELDGEVIGEILLMDLDAGSGACSLRLWITGAVDRGIGTRAIALVLDHAFDTVGLHRVGLEVYAHNPRARRVYDKLGFTHEGTLREALLLDGERVDAHVMGILRREWQGRR